MSIFHSRVDELSKCGFMGVVAGAVIGGGLAYMGAKSQGDAAESAANTSANASNYAADLQKQQFDQTRTDQTPWREAGVNALGYLNTGTSPGGEYMKPFGMSDFQTDPGYQFRLSEGMKALDRSAAAGGNLLSGQAVKGAQRFGQDLASQEYQNAFTRYNQNRDSNFSKLSSMAGIGQSANNALGAASSNYANNVGNLAMSNAANQGNAGMVGANANASMYKGIGNALGNTNWSSLGNSLGGWTSSGNSAGTPSGAGYSSWAGAGYNPSQQASYDVMGSYGF